MGAGEIAMQNAMSGPAQTRNRAVNSTWQFWVIAIAAIALLLFAGSELVLALPVLPQLYVAMIILFGIGLVRNRPLERQPRRLAALALVCAAVAVLHFVPWTSRKPFLRDLDRIRPGMTAVEVEEIMQGYVRGSGWPAEPLASSEIAEGELTIEGARIYRHSATARFNSDWGIVHFEEGRVARVEFSPD
jgi:hypothetical protein